MFARNNARHTQNAYVTNDLERAMAVWRDMFDVPSFHVFDNTAPELESTPPYKMKIALALVGGVEIELIEPFPGQAPLHEEILPADGSFAMRFHHAAMRIGGDVANFEAHMASLDRAAHPVVWRGGLGDVMRYAYTDERATLGHYLEHVWFEEQFRRAMAAAIPSYPAA